MKQHLWQQLQQKSSTKRELNIEAVVRRCSVKKVLLAISSQNSQENTCARVTFLIKLQAFSYRTLLVAASVNKYGLILEIYMHLTLYLRILSNI